MRLRNLLILQLYLLVFSWFCNLSYGKLELYPNQMRCVSRVLHSKKSPMSLTYLQVEEFVDRVNNRSSTRVREGSRPWSTILYNEISADENDMKRKMVNYNTLLKTCHVTQINYWMLSHLRMIHIHLLPSEKQTKLQCDIAMGPSTLLLAIQETAHKFRYINSEFSEKQLSKVDVYEHFMDFTNNIGIYEKGNMFLINIRTSPSLIDQTNGGKKFLVDVLGSDDVTVKAEILSIEICKLTMRELDAIAPNEIFKCSEDQLLFMIDYNIIEEMAPNSFESQEMGINESTDFSIAPFLQPVGIGCWKRLDKLSGEKTLKASSMMFSGEYVTSTGTLDLSYVAYDGERNVLRLDREGRKSVYDLEDSISYHIDELDPNEQWKQIATDQARCVMLEYDNSYITSANSLERLLGLANADVSSPARHLGTRMIEHILYDVYELELLYDEERFGGYNLPILLEPERYKLHKLSKEKEDEEESKKSDLKSYFVTYYVREFPTKTKGKTLQMIKYIELWECIFHSGVASPTLINHLEFTDFSWSLDVEPTNNDGDLQHIFIIESCIEERTQLLNLKLSIAATEKSQISLDSLKPSFKNNVPLIRELIVEKVAKELEIPRLNIAQVDLALGSSHIICNIRIVELVKGSMYNSMLGFAKYKDIVKELGSTAILYEAENRHSLADCQLDSLALRKRNSLMYCPGLTLCILFKEEVIADYKHKLTDSEEEEQIQSSNEDEAICELHQITWTRLSKQQGDDNAIGAALSQAYRIRNSQIEFDIKQRKTGKTSHFVGQLVEPESRLVDSLNSIDASSTVLDIRYTTMKEEPDSKNVNYAVKMFHKETRMEHCQNACQLDDYCQSFSLCSRKRGAIQETDCVLSTLLLTDDIVAQMSKAVKDSSATSIPFKPDNQPNGQEQVYHLYYDSECNLHPKDSISLYEFRGIVEVANELDESKVEELELDKQAQYLSLEECANSAYGFALWSYQEESSFKYCPHSSKCFLYNETITDLTRTTEYCYEYERSHLQFYHSKPFTRVAISLKDMPKVESSEKLEELGLGRWLEGLSFEDCARDCTLLQSNCLAFDHCKLKEDKTLCILYSFRSPWFSTNIKEFLPAELKVYSDPESQASFVDDAECSHSGFKYSYFQVRLDQLLKNSKSPERDNIEQLEEETLRKDKSKSDSSMASNSLHLQGLPRYFATSNGGLHGILLLIGLVVGCVGILAKNIAFSSLVAIWDQLNSIRERRSQQRRISQLVLPSNLEL